FSSTDDDSFSLDNIDYVEASPPNSELVSLEETHTFDNSLPGFITFSNVLFDADYDSDSSDDQSFSDEDVPKKIYSNPLFDEEIISMKIDPHSFNVEFHLIESMPNNDSSIIIPSKIDSLFDEFAGELTLLKSIPPGIDETDRHPEEETYFTKRLLYDNSSPRPPEEFVSDNSNAKIKSFSPSPILVKDSDSIMEEIDLFCTLDYLMPPTFVLSRNCCTITLLRDSDSIMEEIDLFCTPDYPMPPGIVDKDYDSERDILIRKDLPRNNTLSFAEKESFHFDFLYFLVLLQNHQMVIQEF
nr:hypothetical protein [Tanacetum cinerariifolium]